VILFKTLHESVSTSVGIASSIVTAEGEIGETMLYEVLSRHLPNKEGVLVGGGETHARTFEEYVYNGFACRPQLLLRAVIHYPGYESVDILVVRDLRQIHEIDDAQCPICPFTREAYDSLAQTSPVRALPFNQDAYCRHDAYCSINLADIVK
jgi:hypothetical protein